MCGFLKLFAVKRIASIDKAHGGYENYSKFLILLNQHGFPVGGFGADFSLGQSMPFSTRLSLIDRIRAGSPSHGWYDFVEIYDPLILTWLRREGIQSADAEDIRQEVMTTVLREILSFQHSGRPGAFRAWLLRITTNRMRRFWRTRRRQAERRNIERVMDELIDEQSDLRRRWEAQHDKYMLEYLLSILSSRFSEKSMAAFRLISLESKPIREVADDLGMTIGAARVAQHRVLKALKKIGQGLID